MEAKTNRTTNVRRWVAEAGGPAEVSRRSGARWSPGQVSQWISEDNPKGIGHALARDIEQLFSKPKGSMDSQAVQLTGEKLRTAIRFGRDCLAAIGIDSFDVEDPGDSEVVAAAFEYLDGQGIASPTDSDRLAFVRRISEKQIEQRIVGSSGDAGGAASGTKARKKGRTAGGRKRKSA